jgi:hypothetical protein
MRNEIGTKNDASGEESRVKVEALKDEAEIGEGVEQYEL